jgi:GNAT superfamily N-acetyltransferase
VTDTNRSDRVHEALVEAFEILLTLLPDATVRPGGGYRVICAPSFPIPLTNAVWSDGSNEDATVHDLPAALAELEARGMPPAVIARDGTAPRVQDEARRLGLTADERIPGMSVERDAFRPMQRPDVEFRLVGADAPLLETALDVTARGFGAPREFFVPLFAGGMQADGLDLWLAFVDGVPVSTAIGMVRGDTVGIFDVATPPEHRRKGYGALVTAKAVLEGFAAGATLAYLQSSDMGFPVYEALGFRTVSTYVVHTRPREESP